MYHFDQVGETLCDLTPLGGQQQPATSSDEPTLAAAHKASALEPTATAVISEHAPNSQTGEYKSRHKASASPAVRALAREYGVDLSNVVRHPWLCFVLFMADEVRMLRYLDYAGNWRLPGPSNYRAIGIRRQPS